MNVWVDFDNAPQARYLLPLARALGRRGHDVLLTARDNGDTLAILDEEGARYQVVGSGFGRGIPRKIRGLVRRAQALGEFLDRESRRVDGVITGSRAATLAARRRGIPSFVIIDYEHVNLLIYRLSSSYILHPDVIAPAAFRRRGIRSNHLFGFSGLKEDLTFSEVDVEAVVPFELGDADRAAAKVLFRPPAEESHYYRSESRDLALALLRHLAGQDAQIVLSPRDESQVGYVSAVRHWRHEPIVLREAAPFVALLKAVDAVVSAGGTMVREAAYLGVPAYSIFRSRVGAVDRHLASLGRLSLLRSPEDFPRIELGTRRSITPLRAGSGVLNEVAELITERVLASTPHTLARARRWRRSAAGDRPAGAKAGPPKGRRRG